ncbi:MAG TPA: GvpL/GvpF family gas vesicle protein [Terriglobia bacterium]|nr:GvpL/GvpF family gas vesicle protein [Terriglobia bacterium]
MKDGHRAAVAAGPDQEPAVPVASGRNYIYAIVTGDEPRSYRSLGIEGKDVYTITNSRVAAVVSGLAGSKIRPERANLKAHQAVLKCLMADTTPLPMAFGTIAASPEAIRRILVRNQDGFQEQLQRVAGRVEMGLRVAWDVPNIFEYFVNTHAELRLARDRLMGARHEFTQEEKIELGRMFDRLLNEDREDHTRKVERALAPLCVEFKSNQCRNEHEVINLACLVGRDAQEAFSAGVFAAAKLFDNNFAFDYSGPWAPYNFVEIDLEQ